MGYRAIFFSPNATAAVSLPNLAALRDIRPVFDQAELLCLVLGAEIHWPATLFLARHSLISRSATGDTVRTYAESLVGYLNYMDVVGRPLGEGSEHTIQLYRNWLVRQQGQSRGLSPSTTNLRITTAMLFHSWGQRTGNLLSPLGEALLVAPLHIKSNSRSVPRRNPHGSRLNVHVRQQMRIPRIMSRAELQQLIHTAPSPYSLMIKWAVTTGLRRFELCELRISDLPERLYETSKRMREMSIVRKGGKRTTVYLPNALVDETWWHVLSDRGKPKTGSEGFVFLSNRGMPVKRGYVSNVFRRLVEPIAGGMTFHHLRHTFAVVTLTILQRRAEQGDSINPLKTLQVLMGLNSIETAEIYLRAMDIHSDAVEQALHYLYGDSILQ